jgi:hypothetical protein
MLLLRYLCWSSSSGVSCLTTRLPALAAWRLPFINEVPNDAKAASPLIKPLVRELDALMGKVRGSPYCLGAVRMGFKSPTRVGGEKGRHRQRAGLTAL